MYHVLPWVVPWFLEVFICIGGTIVGNLIQIRLRVWQMGYQSGDSQFFKEPWLTDDWRWLSNTLLTMGPAPSPAAIHSIDIDTLLAPVRRDDAFYFELVTFKVEDTLFRVPKHELGEQSQVFRDMFLKPPTGRATIQGTSDENPISLDTVKKNDFKLLLQILYLPKIKDISSKLTIDQCTILLSLSNKWGFEKIISLVKNHLRTTLWDTTPTVGRINFALKYEIKEWYYAIYYELATRAEPLSADEMQKLGLELSAKVARVREEVKESAGINKPKNDFSFVATPGVDAVASQAVLKYLMPLDVPKKTGPVAGQKTSG